MKYYKNERRVIETYSSFTLTIDLTINFFRFEIISYIKIKHNIIFDNIIKVIE